MHSGITHAPHGDENNVMAPRRDELLEIFRKTASEVVEQDFQSVSESTVISDLGIDSLGMLEIVGSMERELKIQIPDESLSGITTIRDLLEVVEKRQQPGTPRGPSAMPGE